MDQDIEGMVKNAKHKYHLHMLHFIHGSGLPDHGPDCTYRFCGACVGEDVVGGD